MTLKYISMLLLIILLKKAESSTTADSVVADEVESWEQRVEETTIGSIEPIGTKGAVTNENTKIAVVPEPERHVMPEEKMVVQSEGSSPHIGDKTPKVKDEPTPAKVVSSSIKTMVVPPKRDSEKENVNIVFIGHVGTCVSNDLVSTVMFCFFLIVRCRKVNYWWPYYVRGLICFFEVYFYACQVFDGWC